MNRYVMSWIDTHKYRSGTQGSKERIRRMRNRERGLENALIHVPKPDPNTITTNESQGATNDNPS